MASKIIDFTSHSAAASKADAELAAFEAANSAVLAAYKRLAFAKLAALKMLGDAKAAVASCSTSGCTRGIEIATREDVTISSDQLEMVTGSMETEDKGSGRRIDPRLPAGWTAGTWGCGDGWDGHLGCPDHPVPEGYSGGKCGSCYR